MTKLGKYEIHESIGSGGFGTVYRTTDLSLDRDVAIKVLHPHLMLDQSLISRFGKEAKTLAALNNHHIVDVYEMVEESGRIYIAMQYLPGGSLKSLIQKNGALPFEQVLSIIKQVIDGLAHIHRNNLVHRDLKPENILFDTQDEAVITDFGLVKTTSNAYDSSDKILGTLNYCAPEIWEGKMATSLSDIYALGCIVFEMLTGYVLFSGDSPPEVMKKHFDGPKFPKHWPAGVPSGINDFLHKALATDPQDRFQDVDDFYMHLSRLRDKGEGERFHWALTTMKFILIFSFIWLGYLAFFDGNMEYSELTNSAQALNTTQLFQETKHTIIISQPKTSTTYPTKKIIQRSATAIPPSPTQIIKDTVTMTYFKEGDYWLDDIPVQKENFAKFIEETGYKTDADKGGGGWFQKIFYATAAWCAETWKGGCTTSDSFEWVFINHANWEYPIGRGYDDDWISGTKWHVGQVSWNDASEYCHWAGKRLPSEDELLQSGVDESGEWVSDPLIFRFDGAEKLEESLKTTSFRSPKTQFRCAK